MSAAGHSQEFPHLDIRAPLVAGVVAVAVFFGAGIGGAAYVPIEQGAGLQGKIASGSKTTAVKHPRGGTISEIKVVEGQHVALGDVLVTVDTQALDEQIGALKAQSEAAVRQLELVRTEAVTMANLLERKLAPKSKVQQLERQVADVSKEAAGLSERIAAAQAELEKSALRAPVAGRVQSVAVTGRGSVIKPGATALVIVPDDDRLVVEARLTPIEAGNLKPGTEAKVRFTALGWRDQRPLPAKLAWISADSTEDKRSGQPYYIARVELDDARVDIGKSIALKPGMRADILLVTGQRTLLSQVFDPLVRSVNRAFRG